MGYKVHEFRYKRSLASEKNIETLEQFLNALEGRVVSVIKYQYSKPSLLIFEELKD